MRARGISIVVALCWSGTLIAAAAPVASAAAVATVKPMVHTPSNFSDVPGSTSCQYYINAPQVHLRSAPHGTDQALTSAGDLFWSSPYLTSGVLAGQRWIRGADLHAQRTGWVGRDYLTLELCT